MLNEILKYKNYSNNKNFLTNNVKVRNEKF